jgi:hypothetical protein
MKTSKRKYPKTYHFEFSGGVQSDDKIIKSLSRFIGKEVVLTEKKDGENTTITSDIYHARSIDSVYNWTRAWISKMHSVLKYDIPVGFKLVGENLFAQHSIRYENLKGYFYLFSIWEDKDNEDEDYCIPYDSVCEYAELLDLPMPKVLFRGIFDEKMIRKIADELDTDQSEGFVCRLTEGFYRSEFKDCVAKYVRSGHVQTDQHWLKNAVQNGKLGETVKPAFMK